ncbi:MAG: serine hydrolase [Ignavibacteriales bacterium]|nr:serine hydrolase [Ignavibacteriales bacterium]
MNFRWILICFLLLAIQPLSFSQEGRQTNPEYFLSRINNFSHADPFVRGEAVTAIAKQVGSAVQYLLKPLVDTNDEVRKCAVIALGKIAPAGTEAIPLLTETLNDKKSEVRWCSAIALGKYKEAAVSAVPRLLVALDDTDSDVRWAAYFALTKISKESINKAPDLEGIIKTVESLTPQLINELHVPGVSICIIKNNEVAYAKQFGYADVAAQMKVDSKTIFEACSMSKPVLSFIVLQLVNQGKLDLDKPLYLYLAEEFISCDETYAKLITARMILAHTSGMPNWRKGDDETGGPIPLYFKPGTRFNYSGEGIYYLQRVVEHITNKPLDVYAKEQLFDKLGLESTSFVVTPKVARHIATGYDAVGQPKKKGNYTHANAAYTLYTTPAEYAQFITAIMNNKNAQDCSVSAPLIQEMVKHQIRVDTREVTDRPGRSLGLYSFRGLGWGIDSTITGDVIYHSGSNQTGFRCYSQFRMNEGSGIVIMANGENGSELWTRLIRKIGNW